ncbi:MAG: methyltransferase domain-containing protein [Gammaproteobacteria bacterium]|nr:methyltransferase domain-containing protein [Gammaproteobacteria bacterium]
MTEQHRPGFSVVADRASKALKIQQVLQEELGRSLDGLRILDVGTGTGEIASELGRLCDVVSVDPVDTRGVTTGYQYVRATTGLPFANASFDIAISNHVIEHLPDAEHHLAELARVVRPDGAVYLATPNRVWPLEVHYRVWLLHWLPVTAFNACLRWAGRFQEPLWLLSWRRLKNMSSTHFTVQLWSDRVARNPRGYHLAVSPGTARILRLVPRWAYRLAAPVHPTFIVVLRAKKR